MSEEFDPTTGLPIIRVSPCEELGFIIEHLWELHTTDNLNGYITADWWRDLDTLKSQCLGLPQSHLDMLAIIERYRP